MKLITRILTLTMFLSVPLSAMAGYRCAGGHLVQVGDSAASILNKCGKPVASNYLINGFGVRVGERLRYIHRTDKKWAYMIDVIDGKVTQIQQERQ